MDYNQEIPKYGDLMTIEDFEQSCKSGYLVDDDGTGHPVKNGKMSRDPVYPSGLLLIPKDATHIIWFNK